MQVNNAAVSDMSRRVSMSTPNLKYYSDGAYENILVDGEVRTLQKTGEIGMSLRSMKFWSFLEYMGKIFKYILNAENLSVP